MSAKSADGKWVEGLDPKLGGGQGGRDYFTECNSWIYTFQVQHDVAGLAKLLGGREKLAAKLDALFTEPAPSKYTFLGHFPDMTGLIGMYAQGNEPSFHIPYLYNYCGQPWKTQRHLREIMEIWYTDTPLGICGDEDGGAMSSWYVLTAMGFYPVTPGLPVYVMGSPIFEETRITLPSLRTVVADIHAMPGNVYVAEHPYYAWLAGMPVEADAVAMHDALRAASPELRSQLQAELH